MILHDLSTGVNLALAHLENGDPCEAVSILEMLTKAEMVGDTGITDAQFRLLCDAREEAANGSPEKAEHLLGMVIAELEGRVRIDGPCPECGRVDDGHWFKPCPSDDCPSKKQVRSQLIAPVSVWEANVVDHQIPMPERFILAIGPVAQQLGIDEQVGGDIVIWDQQEHKVVMVVGAEYSQAVCLEMGDAAPFTKMTDWFNRLSNEAMESEGLKPSKVATLEDVCQWLRHPSIGLNCSLEHQFIEIQLGGNLSANVGMANDTWNGEVVNADGDDIPDYYLETGISTMAINAHDIAKEIARVAQELSEKITNEPKARVQ